MGTSFFLVNKNKALLIQKITEWPYKVTTMHL
jgi:hypothetical protein